MIQIRNLVIARGEAPQQSRVACETLDRFATLAMTNGESK
jgi:hypothetical protein